MTVGGTRGGDRGDADDRGAAASRFFARATARTTVVATVKAPRVSKSDARARARSPRHRRARHGSLAAATRSRRARAPLGALGLLLLVLEDVLISASIRVRACVCVRALLLLEAEEGRLELDGVEVGVEPRVLRHLIERRAARRPSANSLRTKERAERGGRRRGACAPSRARAEVRAAADAGSSRRRDRHRRVPGRPRRAPTPRARPRGAPA